MSRERGFGQASPRDVLEVCTSCGTAQAAGSDGTVLVHVKRARVRVDQVPETF